MKLIPNLYCILNCITEDYGPTWVKIPEEYLGFIYHITIYKDHGIVYTSCNCDNQFHDMTWKFKITSAYKIILQIEIPCSHCEGSNYLIQIQTIKQVIKKTLLKNSCADCVFYYEYQLTNNCKKKFLKKGV